MATEKQIIANRKNAQRSTGPRTPQGKAQVAQNAIKHGILARIVIDVGEGQESAEALLQLLDEVWADLKPEGAMEEYYAQEIVSCMWRLRRVDRVEVGAIRLHQGFLSERTQLEDERRLRGLIKALGRKGEPMPEFNLTNVPSEDVPREFQKFSSGIAWLIEVTDEIACRLEQEGAMGRDDVHELHLLFQYDDTEFGQWIRGLWHEADHGKRHVATLFESTEARKDAIVRLRAHQRHLEEQRDAAIARQKVLQQSRLMARSLPDDEETNVILRHRTTYTRRLDQALDKLRRIQAERQ